MTNIANTYKCPKCSGIGRLDCYAGILGGVCFSCNGKGVKIGKAPTPSIRWAVIGIDKSTGARAAIYFKRAKSGEAAIRASLATMSSASDDFKRQYTLDGAIAVRADDFERDPAITLFHAERNASGQAALAN